MWGYIRSGLGLGLGALFLKIPSFFLLHYYSQHAPSHVTYHIDIPYPQLHDIYSCLMTYFRALPFPPPLRSQPALKDKSA